MGFLKSHFMKNFLWGVEDPVRFMKNFNLYCKLRGRAVRILGYDKDKKFLVQQSNGQSIYVSRVSRIKENYLGGGDRLKKIFLNYLLEGIEFRRSDVVIDVGANIGELSVYLGRQFGVKSIACEPDPTERGCLAGNLEEINGLVFGKPLWETAVEKEFYFRNDSGDSSLLPDGSTASSVLMSCTTLDDLYKDAFGGETTKRIRLLKLEAEGAEPEILRGGRHAIQNIDYVAADLGPERGASKENTVPECVNFLLDRGFKVLRADVRRAIFVFCNSRAPY